jgi:tetratricopeptide (TPR) repeat protein
MFKYKARFIIVLAVMSLVWASSVFCVETWRLGQDQQWKAVSNKAEDRYLLAVAQIKQMVSTGQKKAVGEALNQLKKDFPEIAGRDLDVFIEAEMLFCEDKFVRAIWAYDRLLVEYPESELYEAALDREFAIGTAFLAGRKKRVLKIFKIRGYAEGVKIMEKISDRAGDAPIGIKASVAIAQSYERRGRFNDAYHKWSEISSQWPTGRTGKEALLGMARCKHAAYKGPKYNAYDLISAKSYYENYRSRYPKDAGEINVDGRLKRIDEQQAYKQFSIGEYYRKTGNKESADFYYQMVVDNWPMSTAAKMAKESMNKMSLVGEKVEK